MMVALFKVSEGFANKQCLFVNITLSFAFVSFATDIKSFLNLGADSAGNNYTKELPVSILAFPIGTHICVQ